VNAAVGFALFTTREQVIRLMHVRSKYSKKKTIDLKVKGGVSPTYFKNFAVVNDMVLSLDQVRKFSFEKNEGPQQVLDFIKDNLLSQQPTYTRLVIVKEGQGHVQFMHAIAIRRKDLIKNRKQMPNFWLLDFLNDNPVQFNEDPQIPGIKFDLEKDICKNYHKWIIYNVKESKLAVKKVK